MVVEKADCTWATVPETGRDNPVAEGLPTVEAPAAQRGLDLCNGVRRRSEALCELGGGQELVVLG